MEETRAVPSDESKNEQSSGGEQQQQQSQPKNSMFCVKWNGFANQVLAGLASLFGSQELVDVTLCSADGQRIRAHKIILAMSSPFFRRILKDNPCKHPIVIISGIKFRHVEHVIRFIYMGEVRMREDEIEDFIDAAESLKIDGITSTVNHFDTDLSTEPGLVHANRTGVIRKAEVSSMKQDASRSSSMEYLNHVHDMRATERSAETSPVLRSKTPILNSVPQIPLWPPSYSSGLPVPIGSPWSALLSTSSLSHSQSHYNRGVTDMLEIRTDSSNSSDSPGVIVEMKDESSPSGSESRALPLVLPSRTRSEGDAHSSSSGENLGRRRVNSDEQTYELSMPELPEPGKFSRDTSPATSIGFSSPLHLSLSKSLQYSFPPQRSWTSDFGFPSPHPNPHYLPLSLVAASAILSNPPRFLPPSSSSISKSSSAPISPRYSHSAIATTTATSTKASSMTEQIYRNHLSLNSGRHHHQQQQHNFHPHHHQSSSSNTSSNKSSSSASALSTLRAKLTASMFAHGNSAHFHHKPNNSRSGGLNILSTKPRSRTTTIRSSQVPQSARYTAVEVDAMVERVDNFPGPLVPCTVCQKFVKRERLRAHIHECHLLKGETIVCPQCGIGLKSKGSFRVHIWRHKRGSLGVKKLRDQNLPS